MAPHFLYLKPLFHDFPLFLQYPSSIHGFLPLKIPSFYPFFFLPFAGKVFGPIPQTEFFCVNSLAIEKKVGFLPENVDYEGSEEGILPRFSSLRLRMEESDENLKLDNAMKKEEKFRLEEDEFRIGLDLCSKAGDALGAICLYDKAIRKGLRLQQYHYNVILHLCSSAAIGSIFPAKNGIKLQNLSEQKYSGSLRMRKLQFLDNCSDDCGAESFDSQTSWRKTSEEIPIVLTDEHRTYARTRGFEIYEKMCLEKVPMCESAMTSFARMAMSMGNGDMAFDIVKEMKELGITPKLRSYGPAIFTFSSNGCIDKAFEVEKHMFESKITPEEPELLALLRASVLAGRGEKVYYLLHKLRSIIRKVSPSTADVIELWFRSSIASGFGKRKWDIKAIKQAVENNGGGWHGFGWLGEGNWSVVRSRVSDEGVCLSCREKLVDIDLDPVETENFAESVASLASKRDKNSNFEKFQKWLEYYGPFEAVVDAANVGLFKQRRFSINKVNSVVNGIRQKLPLKKWPLIIVHNRRLLGSKMNEPFNKKLIEKWNNADALYATPTGSNDDWYWLYAAIKCKCLVATNDEMRDHVFEILGNDFFPKWKERHQVRFKHQDCNFQFLMPPPYSVVIQESERGHWHIPIAECEEKESNRIWMCVRRSSSIMMGEIAPDKLEGLLGDINIFETSAFDEITAAKRLRSSSDDISNTKGSQSSSKLPQKKIKKKCQIFKASNQLPMLQIISDIEAAEKIAGCAIDFQI